MLSALAGLFLLPTHLTALFFFYPTNVTQTMSQVHHPQKFDKNLQNIIQNPVAIFTSLEYTKDKLMPFGLTGGISRPITETVMSGHISALKQDSYKRVFRHSKCESNSRADFRPIFTGGL